MEAILQIVAMIVSIGSVVIMLGILVIGLLLDIVVPVFQELTDKFKARKL